jgi:2',3'-cyclic-nucleotide 2'-phosphodiesterase/3'-nucleotidase
MGDVKVGILGLTTKEIPSWEDKSHYAGLKFNDLVEEANKWVPKVRASGADIVVVAMHSGEESPSDTIPENQVKAVAQGVNGIDAIIAGHTHAVIQMDTFKNPEGKDVIVTEPGKWGQYVSRIDFNISKDENGKWVIDSKTSKAVAMDSSIQPDENIMQLAEPYQEATLKYVGTKIGTASGDFLGKDQLTKETALMDLINKVQKYYAKTDLSIAAPLSSTAQILKGDVTIQDMMSVYVFENYLYGIKMTGKQLKDWMEWSARYYQQVKSPDDPITKDKTLNIPDYNLDQLYGASYTIDLTQPVGNRIKNLTVNGKPVKDDDVFTVAINNYRFNGGGGFMKAAGITNPVIVFDSAKAYGDDGQIRNLMISYIKMKGTIDPVVDNYWTISKTPVSEGNIGKKGIVTATALNVRLGAGTNYKVIGVLKAGQSINIVGENNGWYKIDYNGKTGYVYGKYVASSPDLSNVSVLKAVRVTAKDGLNVRLNNSINALKIGAVPYGYELKVVGEYDGWYKVEYNGVYGFVYAKYTK